VALTAGLGVLKKAMSYSVQINISLSRHTVNANRLHGHHK